MGPPTDSVGQSLWDIALMIAACDASFYWVHRLLHLPPLYGWFHKQHHEYKASTVWASEYFGIVDMVR
jgi:sterol desaturase/sphingolipid hydroxylase (fatty acid hydroxylase superfamily)